MGTALRDEPMSADAVTIGATCSFGPSEVALAALDTEIHPLVLSPFPLSCLEAQLYHVCVMA